MIGTFSVRVPMSSNMSIDTDPHNCRKPLRGVCCGPVISDVRLHRRHHESWPYRSDLLAYAESFAARRRRQLWRDDSLSKAEKMLFVGFLFVRKLIECSKISDACARSSTEISRARIKRSREVSAFMRHDLLKDLEGVSWEPSKVDVHQLADKVIHAWWIIPISNDATGLDGFIFTTDRQRNSELWLLPTASVISVFRLFGRSAVRKVQAARDDHGRLTYWKAE
jgi:hypothetical protein